MNIVNVGYDSTNYYLLGAGANRLLVDVGWPGTLPKLLAVLKRKDIALHDIGYLLATHYHPDHAGLAQEVKARGVRLIVMEQQLAALPRLKSYMKPINPYVEIALHDNLQLAARESRAFLKRVGIAGEIAWTPGHSEDSVTLVLDDGAAFTGDLPPPGFVDEGASAVVQQSWDTLRGLGARTIYPGHGPARSLAVAAGPRASS
jgi:glyoxylase-like metal-dependent hydrolase (beta-lactamase superfamily II)